MPPICPGVTQNFFPVLDTFVKSTVRGAERFDFGLHVWHHNSSVACQLLDTFVKPPMVASSDLTIDRATERF